MNHPENGITFRLFTDHDQMSKAAARFILSKIKEKANLLICPAAGNTPVKTYDYLVKHCMASNIKTQELRIIKLDEWGGMTAENPASCEYQIKKQLSDPLHIHYYCGFDTKNKDIQNELKKCDSYMAHNGPIDVCMLGLGLNGHLGFNEPSDDFLKPFSHRVSLTTSSMKHNMISELNKKPSYGLTLGMQSILTSKIIILLISGSHKKQAFAKLMQGQIDTKFPASFLWLHDNVICFYDEEVL